MPDQYLTTYEKRNLTSIHDIAFLMWIPIHHEHAAKSTYQNPILEDFESNTFYLCTTIMFL